MKRVLTGLLVLFLILQAFRPERNLGAVHGPQDVTQVKAVPPQVERILQKACYDCHSNATRYPWYTSIQPVGWWMQHHVNEGKEHLNFSTLAALPPDEQRHALHECAEEVEEGHMPISSYLWVHHDAMLSAAERETLVQWAER